MIATTLAVACGDSKPVLTASASPSASSSAGAKGMGGKLAKAVRAAESAGAVSSANPGSAPPQSGIFGPGEADKALPPDAPPKISLIAEGSEPRLMLKRKAPTEDQKLPLQMSLSNGGQNMLPPITMELTIGPEKPKGDDKGDKDKKPAPKPAASAQASASAAPAIPEAPLTAIGPRIVATVSDAHIAGDKADTVAKLKGSTVSFTLTDGGLADTRRHLAGGDAELDIVLRAVEETLTSLYMPAPDKPIGEGGYFIVADRRTSLGVDVVRYRVFTIDKVNGDVASIKLDQKQYAVAPKIDLPQASAELSKVTLTEYRALGGGRLDIAPNLLFAKGSVMRLQTQAGFGAGEKGQHGILGIQLQALLGEVPAGVSVQQGPQGGDEEPGPGN